MMPKSKVYLIPTILFLMASSASAYSFTFSSDPEVIKFWVFNFKPDFSLGEVLTALSILGSFLLYFLTSRNSQQQRRNEHEKEYADGIRKSSGEIISKLKCRKNLWAVKAVILLGPKIPFPKLANNPANTGLRHRTRIGNCPSVRE
jgi:hypothetical protein